jgi:hypothetical protein
MSEAVGLASRIQSYFNDLDQVVDRTLLLTQKAISSGDNDYWDGVALNLHSFYSGVERIFEDIARTLDQNIPSGPDWHIGLLAQMSSELANHRPAVISTQVRYALDEFRGFRHVVRNVYTFNFKPSRLKELSDALPECYHSVKKELLAFVNFLNSLE